MSHVTLAERVPCAALADHAGRRVLLAGWLHRWRRLSQVGFLVLRDASGLAQIGPAASRSTRRRSR
jgi:nondiscriminating aspartyl-tRNA synthetase